MIDLKTFRNNHKLHELIRGHGYIISRDNGQITSSDDIAVQAIIDSYDPLPESKVEAIALINEASGDARVKYTTNIPFQDSTYQMKLADANKYKLDGYPVDVTAYPFINMESQLTGQTAQAIADLVIATAAQWIVLASTVEGLRQGGIGAVNAATDWSQCITIAQGYVTQLEAL